MIDRLKRSLTMAFGIVTGVFTFVPETVFGKYEWVSEKAISEIDYLKSTAGEVNIIISRVFTFLFIWIVCCLIYSGFLWLRCYTEIKGNNYAIRIEYGDILKKKKCRRVINFDECFTTEVGGNVGDISPTSICGQYLTQNPNIDMQRLIRDSNLVPLQRKSKYNQLTCYQPGSIVPCGDDLLMAFAPLDENGRGGFHSRKEYLECLSKLWEEIDKYFEPKDVCIPLLGAGRTHFESSSGASYSSQELLDIIINSYKLSSCKIKSPYKLRIVVKKNVGISLDKISN